MHIVEPEQSKSERRLSISTCTARRKDPVLDNSEELSKRVFSAGCLFRLRMTIRFGFSSFLLAFLLGCRREWKFGGGEEG